MPKKHSIVKVPDILIPNKCINLKKWAVIACDQYTSQSDYWKNVEKLVGNTPSALHMIIPELYLGKSNNERAEKINRTMKNYLEQGIFDEVHGFIYAERSIGSKIRKGIILCIDLEDYDYSRNSKSKIRATEETVLGRLPPRVKIRRDASLELPHIMLLVNDSGKTLIEPISNEVSKKKSSLKKLYDFELMMNGGHIAGYLTDEKQENQILSAIDRLQKKSEILFAVGDGNHSLATAKKIWEERRQKYLIRGKKLPDDDPARYALVEVVNIYDDSLVFEPIHRVLFNVKSDVSDAIQKEFKLKCIKCKKQEMISKVKKQKPNHQIIGLIKDNEYFVLEFTKPKFKLAVTTVQDFLDRFVKADGCEIDYVHGDNVVCELGNKKNSCGFFLPIMKKEELFNAVAKDGVLPRKTFSMGHAAEKRYYLEARKIR